MKFRSLSVYAHAVAQAHCATLHKRARLASYPGVGGKRTPGTHCLRVRLISEKSRKIGYFSNLPYSNNQLMCTISGIMCLRGAHTFNSHLAASVDLTISDSNLSLWTSIVHPSWTYTNWSLFSFSSPNFYHKTLLVLYCIHVLFH